MGIFPLFFECWLDLTCFHSKGNNSNFTVEKPGKLRFHQVVVYILSDVMQIPCTPGYDVNGTHLCGILTKYPQPGPLMKKTSDKPNLRDTPQNTSTVKTVKVMEKMERLRNYNRRLAKTEKTINVIWYLELDPETEQKNQQIHW